MSYNHICPECGWPVDNPACAAGTCQQRKPAVIDPEMQRQIDEARAELRALQERDKVRAAIEGP